VVCRRLRQPTLWLGSGIIVCACPSSTGLSPCAQSWQLVADGSEPLVAHFEGGDPMPLMCLLLCCLPPPAPPMAGNCDIKNLTRGCKVYMPVFVEGANLSMGDMHFSQGDGEVSFCGESTVSRCR
jgi:hypothetical protein